MRSLAIKIVFTLIAFAVVLTSTKAATSDEYYKAGLSLFQQGQFEQSIKYYQAAIQVDPNNWQAFQGLGHSYYRTGKTQEALAAYDSSLKLNPGNTELQNFVNQLKKTAPTTAPAASEVTTASPETRKTNSTGKWHSYGFKVGVGISQLTVSGGGESESSSSKAGFALGGFYTFGFKPRWAFEPEFLYIQKGGKSTDSYEEDYYYYTESITNDYSTTLSYVEIPLLFKYYFNPSRSFYALLGPSFAIRVGYNDSETTKETFTSNGNVISDTTSSTSSSDATGISSTDYGLNVGLGVGFGKFLLDVRYNLGLGNLISSSGSSSGISETNSTILFTAGMGF